VGEQFSSPTLFFEIWIVPSLRLTPFQSFLPSQSKAHRMFSPQTTTASRSTFLSGDYQPSLAKVADMLAGVRSFDHQARFQVNSPSNLRKVEQLPCQSH
jgi:hypothetical protein